MKFISNYFCSFSNYFYSFKFNGILVERILSMVDGVVLLVDVNEVREDSVFHFYVLNTNKLGSDESNKVCVDESFESTLTSHCYFEQN